MPIVIALAFILNVVAFGATGNLLFAVASFAFLGVLLAYVLDA